MRQHFSFSDFNLNAHAVSEDIKTNETQNCPEHERTCIRISSPLVLMSSGELKQKCTNSYETITNHNHNTHNNNNNNDSFLFFNIFTSNKSVETIKSLKKKKTKQ